MANWKDMIQEEVNQTDKNEIIKCTLSDDELNSEFDDGYGISCGEPFTAWSETRVFFPVVYDGAEWVSSAPRNPCDEPTDHCGGQ